MLRDVYGNASNFGNNNTGVIAGGNVKIVYSSPRPSHINMPQITQFHRKENFLLWRQAERIRSPWDEWDLDKTFFRSLSKYIMDHPEGRLDHVLDRFFSAIEASEDYLVLIPDNPFPARNLMKALGCLLKLGIAVKRTKRDIFEFVKQVVEWVQAVQTALGDDERNQFTYLTWRSLRKTRDLINEICTWAQSRLEDHRWMRIQNGFRIGKEIDEFKAHLTSSKEIFRDLSLLHLQSGMSVILAGIRSILFRQDRVLNEIRKLKKQQRNQQVYLIHEVEEMKRAQVRKAFLEKSLDKRTVSDPDYVTQGKIPCDEGTREAELAEIMDWLNSISPGSQNFLWLTGDPGCGKSAITATLAAHCGIEGVLWAQFFINRNNIETTDPNMFFPTIARQLADFSLEVERIIHDQLKVDPALSDHMTSEQAARLFIDALAAAATLDPNKVVAVIIDGLDETDRNRLYDTADIFSRLFKSLIRHPNVKVFVSSRTEDYILEHFLQRGEEVNVKHVHLDTADSVADVALFMKREIKEKIVTRYKLRWEEWPTEEGMETLAIRASGLFIWAVTAVRYLQAKIDEDGKGCLQFVLTQLTGEALEGINNLYSMVLQSIQKRYATALEREFGIFQEIIGAILVLREPLCLDDLTKLLDLRYGPVNSPVDIVHFVQRLRTVLVAGTDAIDGRTVPRIHKSFFEFITDAALFKQLSLDHRFCVDPAVAEEEMVMRCIRLFANSRKDRGRTVLQESLHLKYASRFCISHVDAAARRASISAVGLVTLDTSVEDIRIRYLAARKNGLSPWFPFDFDGSPPAPFSPLTAAYQVASDRRILATTKSITSLAYSPDGEKIVSGSDDGRLILWDVKEGTVIAELKGHSDYLNSIAFSPSGDRIASGSADMTTRIWNVATTQLVAVLRGHSDQIFYVAFSPVENVVASASYDHSICLWNSDSGELIGSPIQHDYMVWSVTFSKDGNEVISGAEDGLIYIWNRKTRECQQKLKSIIYSVRYLSISPNGDRLVAIGPVGLCFWNRTDSGYVLDDRLTRDLDYGSAAFAPDGGSVLVSDQSVNSPLFFLYDLHTRAEIPIHDDSIEYFALSPNGLSVVFRLHLGETIHISNVPQLLPVTFTSLSPDAEIVVCIFSDGSVWLEFPKNLPAFNKKLEGNVGHVKHLTFSSDNSLLAAVDENSVYLWDVSTQKLHGSVYSTIHSRFTMLSFLDDRCTLTSTHEDESIYAWNAVDGTLHPRQIGHSPSDITFDHLLLLDIDLDHACEIAGARWFPAKSQNSGLWAYVDGTLIRARRDGTVTLLPLDST